MNEEIGGEITTLKEWYGSPMARHEWAKIVASPVFKSVMAIMASISPAAMSPFDNRQISGDERFGEVKGYQRFENNLKNLSIEPEQARQLIETYERGIDENRPLKSKKGK
jgi:hypothetical protein